MSEALIPFIGGWAVIAIIMLGIHVLSKFPTDKEFDHLVLHEGDVKIKTILYYIIGFPVLIIMFSLVYGLMGLFVVGGKVLDFTIYRRKKVK